jgi:glycosyltransferase involved in cell wall biosynthesis
VAQEDADALSYEILVVDNNSTDDTRDVVERLRARHPALIRYLFEPRQGKSFALNRGVGEIGSEYYAIVDDDFILPPDWVRRVTDGFAQHPDAAFLGGKVLPRWIAPPPPWLGPAHWPPIALADYGETEFIVSADRPICLLACTFRTTAVRAAGGYDTRLSVSAAKIGGVEDLEILQRLWESGRHGVYLPHLSFEHKVEARRLTKAYHLSWHRGHGTSYAMLRDRDFERSRLRVLGAPLHVYRRAIMEPLRALIRRVAGDQAGSFAALAKASFAWGFLGRRWRDALARR